MSDEPGNGRRYFDLYLDERQKGTLKLIDEREKQLIIHLEAWRREAEAARREVDITASTLREKLSEMNNFRQQLDRERALYVRMKDLEPMEEKIQRLINGTVTNDNFNSRMKSIEDRLTIHTQWKNRVEGGYEQQKSDTDQRFKSLGIIIGISTFFITMFINVIFRFWPSK